MQVFEANLGIHWKLEWRSISNFSNYCEFLRATCTSILQPLQYCSCCLEYCWVVAPGSRSALKWTIGYSGTIVPVEWSNSTFENRRVNFNFIACMRAYLATSSVFCYIILCISFLPSLVNFALIFDITLQMFKIHSLQNAHRIFKIFYFRFSFRDNFFRLGPAFTRLDEDLTKAFAIFCGISICHVSIE